MLYRNLTSCTDISCYYMSHCCFSEISSIKQAKELQAAEVRRQATPVVGDMRPLADALPDLSQLISPASTAPVACRKSRKIKV